MNLEPIWKPLCLLLERRGFPRRPEPQPPSPKGFGAPRAAPLPDAGWSPGKLLCQATALGEYKQRLFSLPPAKPSLPPPASRRAAFTMLEMLLALAIFAILLGLVITAMPRWQQTARVKYAAQLTKTGLEFARDRANAMNSNTRFSIETNAFWVAAPFTSAVLLSNTLPKGVRFATNSITTFAPGSRTTDSTNSVDIILTSTGNPLTSTIRVSQASATVRIIR